MPPRPASRILLPWLLLVLSTADLVGQEPRPNVVVFLVDDLGYTDSSTYGSEYYETPNLDELAASGVRFTNAYASCNVCSPTRASIMTGKTPARLHLTDWISGHGDAGELLSQPAWTRQLRLDKTTIAEVLKSVGYRTGFVGKWHLGERNRREADPIHQGFDENTGGNHRGSPNGTSSRYFADSQGSFGLPGLGPGSSRPGEYLTDRLTTAAVDFVGRAARGDAPFFLFLSHYAVHTPIQAKQDLIDKYRAKPTSATHTNATYAAMIESMDQSLGVLLDTLGDPDADGDPVDEVASNTAVFFLSDNGGLIGPTDNSPLRAGKGTNYEGGTRIPLVISGVAAAGRGTVSDVPVVSYDLFPTILELVGIVGFDPGEIDGTSLVPLLLGQSIPERAITFHYPHYHTQGATPHSAIRSGDLKLLMHHESGSVQLFDLAEDIGERRDLAPSSPALVTELRRELESYLAAVDAQYPLGSRFPTPSREPDGAGIISINLGTGPNTTLSPEEFAGIIEENHWNNAISPAKQGGSGRLDRLVDADGNATDAMFEFEAGYMNFNSNLGSGDYRMMEGWGGNKASDTGNDYSVRGLSDRFTTPGYDVYVYYDSNSAGDRARRMSFRIGATTLFARELSEDYNGRFVEADTSQASSFATALPGNYIVFRDLRGAGFDLVVDAADDFRGTVNGLQIVARPRSHASFRRGDADASGGVDAADAVFVLEYLFLRASPPTCLASADVNGDTGIDIADPVSLLFFHFRGGNPPHSPFPGCGQTRGVELGCRLHSPCEGR